MSLTIQRGNEGNFVRVYRSQRPLRLRVKHCIAEQWHDFNFVLFVTNAVLILTH